MSDTFPHREQHLDIPTQLKVMHLRNCISMYEITLDKLAVEPVSIARQENRTIVIHYFIDLISDTYKEIDTILA